jgi:hypothetical protein
MMKKSCPLNIESLEARDVPATGLPLPNIPAAQYSIDGSGNNLANPDWGSTGENFLRIASAEYADGLSAPAGADRPSPRLISNILVDQADQDIISDRNLSAMVYAWGQFIDHDLDLTMPGSEAFPIAVPTGDPYFDPLGTGNQTISTTRSAFDAATGTTDPRQQFNAISAFIDGSMIYGSDRVTATALRTLSGGKLKTSAGNMLPRNDDATFPDGTVFMANGGPTPDDELFAAGDIRANENIELTALHTLFVREHNYWADRISAASPGLSDEQIYQKARAIVIAEVQSITYNQWLPAVLGKGLERYTGYKADVNPGISNEFATAAFRFGHSLLGDDVEFLDNNGMPVRDGVPLSEAFFNPNLLAETGIDPVLKYLASDPASELDTKIVNSVRNFLFGPPGAGGLDLASLNIQRGRDHGLADYNDVRAAYGLPRVTSFAEITTNADTQAKLEELYGSVDNIDLWVGALSEDHVKGASVGPTLQAIMTDQFRRLRDGDRFWYQSTFTGPIRQQIENTTLTDILRRNTSLTSVQHDAFFFRAGISGAVFADTNNNQRREGRELGLAGISVELVDRASGEVVATTQTDRRGNYLFGVEDGLRTGQYFVRVTTEDGGPLQSRTVPITAGDQFAKHVDVGVPALRASAPRAAPRPKPNLAALDAALADEVNAPPSRPRRGK